MLELMAEKSQERLPLMVSLQPDARKIIEKIREDTGIPQTEALKRLLEWFAGLDRKLRLAILDNDPATRDELVRLAFAGMLTKGADVATLADFMRRITEQFAALTAKPAKALGRLPRPEAEQAPQPRGK